MKHLKTYQLFEAQGVAEATLVYNQFLLDEFNKYFDTDLDNHGDNNLINDAEECLPYFNQDISDKESHIFGGVRSQDDWLLIETENPFTKIADADLKTTDPNPVSLMNWDADFKPSVPWIAGGMRGSSGVGYASFTPPNIPKSGVGTGDYSPSFDCLIRNKYSLTARNY